MSEVETRLVLLEKADENLNQTLKHVCRSIDKQTEAHLESTRAFQEIAAAMKTEIALVRQTAENNEKKISETQSGVKEANNNIQDVQKKQAVLRYQAPLWGVGGGVLGVSAYKTLPPFVISLLKMLGF